MEREKQRDRTQTNEEECVLIYRKASFPLISPIADPPFPPESSLHNRFPNPSLFWLSSLPHTHTCTHRLKSTPFKSSTTRQLWNIFMPQIWAADRAARDFAWPGFSRSLLSSFHKQAGALIRSLCQHDNALVYIIGWDAPLASIPINAWQNGSGIVYMQQPNEILLGYDV